MIRDFIDEWYPLLLFGGAVALIITLAVWGLHSDSVERQHNCDRAYGMATTARDSITVMGMCELRQQHTTTVVSTPVYVR